MVKPEEVLMEFFDITLAISPDIPTWPGDLKVRLERVKKIEEGATDNLSQMEIGVHTGTHVDAPFHFVSKGIKIDELPLETLIGPVQVVQVADSVDLITADTLKGLKIDLEIPRILFKTRNSGYWLKNERNFQPDFVAISEDAAKKLVEMGMILVGIDYLSVGPFKNSKPTHDALLGAGLVLLEGADLSQVEPGEYRIFCLPLKLRATEGAPARVVLVRH
jgi:arylformamidase